MSELAARNGGRAGLAALAAILLLGLGLRAVEAWEGRSPVHDAVAYERIAANLSAGDGFRLGPEGTQPASNYSPGLPLLVGGLYALSGGEHERLARLVLALLGSLAVLFAYLIARRLVWSARLTRERSSPAPVAGLVAALPVAVYPALLEYQGMLMGEPLGATLLSGAVLAAIAASGEDRKTLWLVSGLLLGALALVRPEYLAISVLLAVVVLVRDRREWRVGLVNSAILLAGVVLVVAPWTVRNAVVLDRFVPVSTGGGQVLFAGSYLPSGGDPERVGEEVLERHPGLRAELPPDPRLEQILAALAAQRHPGLETDTALGRMGRERLEEAISGEPLAYAGFVAAKLARTWSPGPRAVMERPVWTALHWALLALAAVGLAVLARQRRWEAFLLGTILLATAAVGALLVASPRRVLVLIPLLAALAGVGAAWVRSASAGRDSLPRWLR